MTYFEELLNNEREKDYFKELTKFVNKEYRTQTVFPPKENIFNSLRLTPYENVKVVIIGQDPYHGVSEAHGLSFSVMPGIKVPPSLQNIFKELHDDLGCYVPNNGFLEKWAKQGVLLLNSVLTVRKDCPGSHRDKGWEIFTDTVISEINKKDTPVVFLLWGSYAKQKKSLITNPKHLVLETVHPSPFSARNGFFGCKHFSKTNEFLTQNGMDKIDFQIENI